ncbi:uncharacterized protein LOC110991640 isoform X1 [Pieris rapae]|uniref:uncharacterized protein LOC110991640 isoform X1 n=1 Tax=Pieris rapae TaxID=64459 RepID=UPI001E27A6EC|nr:uncharacterized protein LOC110991640 isoform X1 [Pieris rapae]XP_045484705.1 uncharacterized protein LOC110991640 isoform X1 [Pieris rapae]
MKTKQPKEETDKSIDEDTVEPKTRARKKASDLEEEKSKASQDEAKNPQETKKPVAKPKGVIRKRPLGIRKTKKLRSKKVAVIKKNVIKQKAKRGRKPLKKPDNSQEKEAIPLIPASEIKKEPVDDTTPNSRSSSPKTAGRRSRLSSDMLMMKSVLGDSPSSLILGPRTSPYSMRSERSNSPSLFEGKNLRSGKPRKLKNNLLNEVVIKEQKKRTRLPSDSKQEMPDSSEDCKRVKRGRSCSRDGSEISKCSDITESDISLNETLTEPDKELNKKTDKPKTELDIDIDTNVQISTIEKVPSPNVDSKPEIKPDPEPSSLEKDKRRLSLKRSTSLDSDNNNSNRVKINNLNTADIELKLFETENDTLLEDRSSILNCMSKTFNSKEVSKNIRKARRGKKTATTPRAGANQVGKSGSLDTEISEPIDTVDSLSKEITDLIHNLDQNIDCDQESTNESNSMVDQMQSKSVRQFYGLSKPLGDNNSIVSETPAKEKDSNIQITNEGTPIKDDSENIRLHYEDSEEKSSDSKPEITYKRATVASIDKLMDRLKEFEEFDKRRKRQQSESKSNDKTVMVTNDVVLIPKSGADIKPLKDMQPEKSPERFLEKENVLSCFENNSAISIVKRDQVRRSIDVDLPNSVTLIKRNSVSARKESTSSNHSKESDAISIFEKSLGKDVTLTEIRKSVDKPVPSPQVDLHQFATLQPNNPTQTIGGVTLDSSQISITPRNVESKLNCSDIQIMKRNSRESISRKSSGSSADIDDKMATLEKIKSPQPIKKFEVSITPTPVAVKSPEVTQPVETEALAPPLVDVGSTPENISSSETVQAEKMETVDIPAAVTDVTKTIVKTEEKFDPKAAEDAKKPEPSVTEKLEETKTVQLIKPKTEASVKMDDQKLSKPVTRTKSRSSTEMPGPSNLLHETPESQKRKENVLRTLGLLTHKAANEAKAKKLKEKELIYGANYNIMGKGKASKSDYTGTLKTVIKLNRGDKKRHRSSLKMTFQKSKHRGKPLVEVGEAGCDDEAYYTIERREGVAGATLDGGHRKSHYSNRSNNHDTEAVPEPEPKETVNLVIPEKASSFSIHPGRLCMDQCFYCGGKFGLFDTPCHIAQMKSSERQKKVLDNEEKLTIDSCLCDACYRHVDRRANCPSYRKRPMGKPLDVPQPPSPPNTAGTDKPVSPPLEEESEEEPSEAPGRLATCHTSGCVLPAEHSIRRKWLIKMRSSVNKLLQLDGDYPGLHTIPLCGEHYRILAPLMACILCRRRLTKHHNLHFIHHGYTDLNPMLKEAGIPVQFTERPVLCKVCRYYCTLLQRPGHNDNHARAYRRKLLEIYNIDIPPELEQQTEDTSALEDCNNVANRQKKRTKIKIKQRKSTEPETSESSERMTESSPEKEKLLEETESHKNTHLEEDIESLISSNKIPVPGAKPPELAQSDCSESEMAVDETQLIGVDKQTELRYLLQKQNNPARFQKLNLTQKNRNILKVQNLGIQKVGQQQRIADKNVKRIQKLGQIVAHKEKPKKETEIEEFETDKSEDVIKNISLNDECTIETIPNKRPADINTLKNKWQLSESFSQVKKNLSELSKKIDKDPKKPSDSKYSNPVKRLETNPSISVRELFPGEEEMNLQCNVEFNNVKGITPAGWEKCNSLIQFDVETKKLWNELQRPYGNQSSFLRHLILLEKYFRSGDLILSHNASPHAANYNNSMQKRLKAYDNVAPTPVEAPKTSSLIEFRKKPSVNGKSLLKSSQTPEKKFMPPPDFTKPSPKTKKSKQLPPELIAINTPNAQGRKAIQNVLHNIQQLVKGVSASDPTEVAAAPLPPPKFEPPKEKKEPPKEQKDKKETPKEPKEKKEPKKQKSNNKGWRPTLMPITQENVAKIAREPLKTAVDGHSLPSLVQVISSGNRYHISFEDYNKMCLIRKERQQRLHEKKSTKPSTEETSVVTEVQTSAMLGNGGTVVQNITTEKDDKSDAQLTTNAATILKNVGLKNITIAPIPPKTSTMTSQTLSLVTSQPLSVVTPQIITNAVKPVDSSMSLPKIPKSLTVIPQVVPQVLPVVTTAPSQTDSRP